MFWGTPCQSEKKDSDAMLPHPCNILFPIRKRPLPKKRPLPCLRVETALFGASATADRTLGRFAVGFDGRIVGRLLVLLGCQQFAVAIGCHAAQTVLT